MSGAAITDEQVPHWDLTLLFASADDPSIQESITNVDQIAESLVERFSGRVGLAGGDEMADLLEAVDSIEARLGRLVAYAFLAHVDDHRSVRSARLISRVDDLRSSVRARLGFLDTEIAAMSDEAFAQLTRQARVPPFERYLLRRRLSAQHRLDRDQEHLIAMLSPLGRTAWERLAAETLAGTRVMVEGREVSLTEAFQLRSDIDRGLGRRASEAIGDALNSSLALRSYILNMLLLEKSVTDKLRRYPTWLSARSEENELSLATVEAMVSAVSSRYELVHRYYNAKRQLLGLDKLFDWDRFVSVGAAQASIPWHDARRLVVDAYAAFSPRLAGIVDGLFEQGVIEGGNRESSGGFCEYTAPGFPPYISVNYIGRLENVLTLGHELGHGAHISLSGLANKAVYYQPPQVLSETASLFGETLVLRELLKRADASTRAVILCRQLEQAIDMIFRNVAFHQFEGDLYLAREERGELSAPEISTLWLKHNALLYGDSVELTPAYEPSWSVVSHIFRFPGYLHAYAFGNLLAFGLLARWEEEGERFVDRYIGFLSAGGSVPPPVLAAQVGVEIEREGFWNRALDYVESQLEKVEGLVSGAP